MNIPADLSAKINEAITHYPVSKRSAALPLLHLFQEHFGFISSEAILWIADKLELQPINILELVTFYPMLRQKPAGKFHIRICRTLSCALAGSYELRNKLAELAGIEGHTGGHAHEPGGNGAHEHEATQVSPDGRVSIEFVECLASCGTAPVCMVNDEFFDNATPDKAGDLMQRCL